MSVQRIGYLVLCSLSLGYSYVASANPSCTLTAEPVVVQLGQPVKISIKASGDRLVSASIDGQKTSVPEGSVTLQPRSTGPHTARGYVKTDQVFPMPFPLCQVNYIVVAPKSHQEWSCDFSSYFILGESSKIGTIEVVSGKDAAALTTEVDGATYRAYCEPGEPFFDNDGIYCAIQNAKQYPLAYTNSTGDFLQLDWNVGIEANRRLMLYCHKK